MFKKKVGEKYKVFDNSGNELYITIDFGDACTFISQRSFTIQKVEIYKDYKIVDIVKDFIKCVMFK